MSSLSLSSVSSVAAATVTVTARDIEFSNYNSSTGKWDNAVLTMMIEDTDTPDNINLEVYDEKVYAVFRNHDDPTDLIQTSAEVDGMDFRVTISTPMVASAKYELYKVYGETSGNEYATSSQFYIQVPGKVWDFANDTVEYDVELVSDWFNYGEVEDINGNIYGIPTRGDAEASLTARDVDNIVINGNTISKDDIVRIKYTSMVVGELLRSDNKVCGIGAFAENLRDIDIVSSKITLAGSTSGNTVYNHNNSRMLTFKTSAGFNRKFAFPETMTDIGHYCLSSDDSQFMFNKPIKLPDSIVRIGDSFLQNSRYFNSKIIFPNHDNLSIGSGFMYYTYRFTQRLNFSHKFASIGSNFMYYTGYPGEFTYPMFRDTHALSFKLNRWTPVEDPGNTFIVPDWYTSINGTILDFCGGSSSVEDGQVRKVEDMILPSSITSTTGELYTYVSWKNGFNADFAAMTPNLVSLGNVGNSIYSAISKLTLPEGLITCGDIGGRSDFRMHALDDFEFPSTLTTIGNFCGNWASRKPGGSTDSGMARLFDENNILKFPSTLTSIGNVFFNFKNWFFTTTPSDGCKFLDLSESRPEYFTGDDSFKCSDFPTTSDRDHYNNWKITVAPGTIEEWEAKFPDITTYNSSRNRYDHLRRIEWVEKPTKYGYVFYETNYEDESPTKGYVELQSMTDFNKFVNGPEAVSDAAITVDTDDQGNTIELHFGIASRSSQGTNINTITGFCIGTDITAIPDNFLRTYRYLKRLKWGGNETSIGSYVGYNAGQNLKTGDTTVSYDLANIPDAVTTIGEYFFGFAYNLNEEVRIPNSVTSLSYFLRNCTSLNQPVTISNSVTSLSHFLYVCTSFNQPITIPDSITSLSHFLYNCTSFDQPITIPNSVTSLTEFLSYCTSFNQPIAIPNSVTSLTAFLFKCDSFNQPITVPDSVTSLRSFLHYCKSFNQPITISNSVTSLSGFLYFCTSFNQPITIPDSVTSMSNFLYSCTSFNHPITIPDSVETLSDFLRDCTSFDQPISVNNTVNISGFLSGCTAFNSTVTVNNVGSHSGKSVIQFLKGCTAFNQPLDLSPFEGSNQFKVLEGASSFNSQLILPTSIKMGDILNNGSAFNQPITLPELTSGIYYTLCYGWKSFNQPITIPASWCRTRWYNNATLFENCDSLTSTVTFSSSTVPNGTDTAVIYKSFSTTDSTAPCYTTGVTFAGTGADAWKNVLPDYDGSQETPADTYRKINVV